MMTEKNHLKIFCNENRLRWCTLGLGSNLGVPIEHIKAAFSKIASAFESCQIRHSSLYLTPPLPGSGGGQYVNAVCQIYTNADPFKILKLTQQIESDLGRIRDPNNRWAPRSIDIDILFYEELQISSSVLTLPHPRVFDRSFTLFPLYEIDPKIQFIRENISLKKALSQLKEKEIKRLQPYAQSVDDIDTFWQP